MVTIQWPVHGVEGGHCTCEKGERDQNCICNMCAMKRREKRDTAILLKIANGSQER